MIPAPDSEDGSRTTRRETSLRRALDILGALGVAPGQARVTDLAERTGHDKSQVSRTLKILLEHGFIDRSDHGRGYALGLSLYALAERLTQARLPVLAEITLASLSAQTGESAYLSVLRGGDVITTASRMPPSLLAVAPPPGVVPARSTAAGTALLLDHDDADIVRLLSDGDPSSAPAMSSVMERVAQARAAGVAIVADEFTPGLTAVAAPVRDFRDAVIAAVNVSGPSFRVGSKLEEIGHAVQRSAADLTQTLRSVAAAEPRTIGAPG